MRIDQNTKLKIAELHHKGLNPGSIRKGLSSDGRHIPWSTVKFYVDKCRTGEIGELRTVDISDETAQQFSFKKVTSNDVIVVRESLITNPTQSSRDIQKLLQERGTDISLSTCKKVISSAGFTHTRPRYCQMIRDTNKQKRLQFCRDLIASNDTFDDVIFPDKCSIELAQNKITSYRLKGAVQPMLPKAKHPLKIHVWAGISRKGATQIIQFEGIMEKHFFINEILDKTLKPFIRQNFPAGTPHRFQQDNILNIHRSWQLNIFRRKISTDLNGLHH